MQLSLNNSIQETEVVQEKKQPVIKSKWDYQIAVKTLEAMYLNGMSFYPSIEDALRDLYPLYPSFEYKVDAVLEKIIAERGSNFEEKFISLYNEISNIKFNYVRGKRQDLLKLTYEICILDKVYDNYSIVGVDVSKSCYILLSGSRAYKLFETNDKAFDKVKKFYNDNVSDGRLTLFRHKQVKQRAFAYNILTGRATDSVSKEIFDNLLRNEKSLVKLRLYYGIETRHSSNYIKADTYYVRKESGSSKLKHVETVNNMILESIRVLVYLRTTGRDKKVNTVKKFIDELTDILVELDSYKDCDLLCQSTKYRDYTMSKYAKVKKYMEVNN